MVGQVLEVMGGEEHLDLEDLEVGLASVGWPVMLDRTLLLAASTRVG